MIEEFLDHSDDDNDGYSDEDEDDEDDEYEDEAVGTEMTDVTQSMQSAFASASAGQAWSGRTMPYAGGSGAGSGFSY